MKTLLAIGAAIVAMAALPATPASAREGCGPGFHRGSYGHCRPNRGQQMRQMRWAEGRFYRGQGYWHHNRWYHQRHRRNGVWIYL
jgi:hypothetical protein